MDAPRLADDAQDLAPHRLGAIRIFDIDLQVGDGVLHLEIDLRGFQRHENKTGIVLVHADAERGGNLVGPHARNGAEGGNVALGRNQRNLVANAEAQQAGQPRADQNRIHAVHVVQGTGHDVIGDDRTFLDVFGPHTAHHRATCNAARRRHDLALDHGRDQNDAGNLADLIGQIVEIFQFVGIARHHKVTVDAQNPAKKFLAEAVHHRHDDDQRRHAKGNSGQRKPRDDRNESLLPASPQVAHGHHTFEGREHVASPSLFPFRRPAVRRRRLC